MNNNICDYHPEQRITILCLYNSCKEDRLGCQKCLLSLHKSHIKSCVLISEIQKKQHCVELFANNQNEQQIVKFSEDELIHKDKLNSISNQLQQSLKRYLKQIKLNLLEQESKQKTIQMKHNKEILNSYFNSYEFEKLKEQLNKFKTGQSTEEQINDFISKIIKDRQNLQNVCQNQLTQGSKQNGLPQEFKDMVVTEVCNSLESIKNFMRKDDSIFFYKSLLSQEEDANIQETIKGKQFIFNDQDEVQLIYGSCTLSKGIYEFQIAIEYIQNEQSKQEEQQEGLASIVNSSPQLYNPYSQHTIGGHISNSGIFAQQEYQHLHRVYIGVVEDLVKDQMATYSIMYQTQQCCAVDIVRGAAIGSFHMKQQLGEKIEPIQTLFHKNMKKGLVLAFKINLDENKLILTDSENKTRYEGQLYNMTGDNIKPYILIYKSNVKVTIN
ncbi:unnamed protein product [Paramecium primaurelia]|uniref:Uncharacterized protein n=1 Tax=Paramecium primaurelia TaxID=5886 RepID=A0A8S1KUB0_PARPR|nr:unnamed protein product [Paramecium primaurelia]